MSNLSIELSASVWFKSRNSREIETFTWTFGRVHLCLRENLGFVGKSPKMEEQCSCKTSVLRKWFWDVFVEIIQEKKVFLLKKWHRNRRIVFIYHFTRDYTDAIWPNLRDYCSGIFHCLPSTHALWQNLVRNPSAWKRKVKTLLAVALSHGQIERSDGATAPVAHH